MLPYRANLFAELSLPEIELSAPLAFDRVDAGPFPQMLSPSGTLEACPFYSCPNPLEKTFTCDFRGLSTFSHA